MVQEYKAALEQAGEQHSALLGKDFHATLETQKYHYLNCVHEIYDDKGIPTQMPLPIRALLTRKIDRIIGRQRQQKGLFLALAL